MKSSSHAHDHEEFSLPLFLLTVALTLAGIFGTLWYFFPGIWNAQLNSPIWKAVAVFASVTLLNCFVEYFFHRYVLHTPALPLFKHFYKLHTLHHGLTHIVRKPLGKGSSVLVIENKFPMIEPEQHEASFFPWYTLAAFAFLLSPLFALLHFLAPSFPWFLAGYAALASSICLYEIFHAINHWEIERWAPLITNPRWKKFWLPVYSFHLRHHAVTDCNESVSGFFGLPLGDWLFRTCIIPKTVYAQGEAWSAEKFASPQPRALIRWLDKKAAASVQRERARRVESTHQAAISNAAGSARVYSRGEQFAHWLTHHIGLATSIAGLTLLVVYASLRGDAWHLVSCTVFGLTLLLLYTVSTIRDSLTRERARRWILRLNHTKVFLLVAATSTPFLLTELRGPWGWTLFGAAWALCGAVGIFQWRIGQRSRSVAILAYLFLGWLFIMGLYPIIEKLPAGALWLLLGGGLCYMLGILFYRLQQVRYHHAFWHGLVLAGNTCNYLAVLLFLLPGQGM
ncbi:MAG: hemolysin III family protein [Nibricoccus sp.]